MRSNYVDSESAKARWNLGLKITLRRKILTTAKMKGTRKLLRLR